MEERVLRDERILQQMQRIGAGEKAGLVAKESYSLTSIGSEKPKGRLLSETQGLKPLKKDIALATINSTSDLEKTAPRKKTFRISSNTSSVGVGTTTEERRISANSSSKLPANDSQVEDKSAQAQSSQVSENNSITGDWSRKTVKTRLVALPDALNQTQSSKQHSGTTLRLTDLGGNAQSEQKTETQLTLKLLNSRIKEDKKDYQEFLEALGLMRYYDELWELGVDTLEALANVDVEQLNLMKMPAGVQIKMQRELKKRGYQSEGEIRDMAVGTDANDSHIQITENPAAGSVKQAKVSNIKDGKLNFGIKVQKIEKTSESIGTDPLPFDDDIPLNINTDGGGGKVMIPSSLKTKLEPTNSKSKSISQQATPAEKFSFASLGDTNWDNLMAFQSDPSALTLVDNNKQKNSMSNHTRPVTAKKVSCYSCYKSVPEDEAYTHRSLISKVISFDRSISVLRSARRKRLLIW